MSEQRRSAYAEKLRDPRWQKKRLEIMQHDEFTCIACGDTESTLNVHHRFYQNGKDPWDYPDWSLVTLCESCHQEETESLKTERPLVIEAMSRCGAKSSDFNDIACSLAYHFENGTDERFWSALSWVIRCKSGELIESYFAMLADNAARHREAEAAQQDNQDKPAAPEAACTGQ